MTTRPQRKTRVQVEALERRDTPSTALAVHHAAAQSTSKLLRGTGRETVSQTATLSDGTVQATSALNGIATPLGTFTGAALSQFSSNQLQVESLVVFVAANGDQLEILTSGSYRAPRAHATRTTGAFTFSVIGGTGAFANATGSGKITGTVDLHTGDLGFSISGRIIE